MYIKGINCIDLDIARARLLFYREGELSSPLVWNTAYELTYQWIGQYITPYRWMDASENKGLNSFLAAVTTMDVSALLLSIHTYIYYAHITQRRVLCT